MFVSMGLLIMVGLAYTPPKAGVKQVGMVIHLTPEKQRTSNGCTQIPLKGEESWVIMDEVYYNQ